MCKKRNSVQKKKKNSGGSFSIYSSLILLFLVMVGQKFVGTTTNGNKKMEQNIEINEKFIDNILHRLNFIGYNLEDIATNFKKNHSCSETEEKLRTIRNRMNEIFKKYTSAHKRSVNCEYTITKNKNICDELVKLTHCNIDRLEIELKYVKTKLSSQDGEFPNSKRSWIRPYKSQAEVLNMILEKYEDMIINAWSQRILKNKDTEKIKIFDKNHTSTFRHFLDPLIEKAYGNDMANSENVIKFIGDLPNNETSAIAYLTLFEKMQNKNNSNNYQIFLIAHGVNEKMYGSDYSAISQEDKIRFIKLNNSLTNCVNNIIDSTARNVRNNGDTGKYIFVYYKFEKQHPDVLRTYYGDIVEKFEKQHPDVLRTYYGHIVEKAYNNTLKNAENIMDFNRHLKSFETRSIGYLSLYNQMKLNGHLDSYQLVILASRIKINEDLGGFYKMPQIFLQNYITINNSLPNTVRDLVWGSNKNCTIFNSAFNENLHSGNQNNSFMVYTSKNVTKEAFWELIPQDYDRKFFIIKNLENGRYLHLNLTTKYNVETSTSLGSNYNNWTFIPTSGKFYIMNLASNLYLRSNNFTAVGIQQSTLQRYVIALRYVIAENLDFKSFPKEQALWQIKCNK